MVFGSLALLGNPKVANDPFRLFGIGPIELTAVRLNSNRRPQDIVSAPIIGFVVGNDLKAK